MIYKQQQQSFCDIQLIQPVQPLFVSADEIPSSNGSTYTALNTVDLTASVFHTQPEINKQLINSEIDPMSPICIQGNSITNVFLKMCEFFRPNSTNATENQSR